MVVDNLILLVAMLVLVAVSAERITEMVKALIPDLADKWKKVVYPAIAMVVGFGVAYVSQDTVNSAFAFLKVSGLLADGLTGVLASAGAGFWNSILTILKAIKDAKIGK